MKKIINIITEVNNDKIHLEIVNKRNNKSTNNNYNKQTKTIIMTKKKQK